MAINFPNNPAVNDTFTVSGTTFTFTGVKWESSAVVELSSDTTPSLGGDLDATTHNINNVGVITATTFSGNLTGNADTATTATNAQGLTGDPSIQVTNATVLGNLDVQGTTTTIDTAITEVDSLNVEGSVGIGTTNALTKTHIDGTNGDNSTLFITASDLDADYGGTISLGGNYDGTNRTAFSQIKGLKDNNTSGQYGGYLSFLTRTHGGSPSERLRITSDGKVGINSTIPTSQLDVNGNITSSGTVKTGTISTSTAGGAGSTLTGDGRLTLQFPSGGGDGVGMFSVYLGTSKNIEFFSGGSATFAGTISDSMGPLRRLGIQGASGSFTLAADHAGKLVRSTGNGSTLTIPQNVFSAGDMISIFNVSTGNNTIAEGTGATLYNTADGATGNRTLGPKGVCTILCTSTNEFIISGSQVS